LLAQPLSVLANGEFSALLEPEPQQAAEKDNDTLNNMAFYALSLSGTPYKYGGTSPDTGFDCSGFVGHVFKYSLDITLPRSTAEIWRWGKEINQAELLPGDLVFYNTLRRSFSHVGIYLGDQRFVHSPSSGGGIRVENMMDDYWQHHFNGARRITSPH
jgi:cell wall-associated NlpC family hydrolase